MHHENEMELHFSPTIKVEINLKVFKIFTVEHTS